MQAAERGNAESDARICFTGLYYKAVPECPGLSCRVQYCGFIWHERIYHLGEIIGEARGGVVNEELHCSAYLNFIWERVSRVGVKGVVGKGDIVVWDSCIWVE